MTTTLPLGATTPTIATAPAGPVPTVQVVTCVVLTCATCGDSPWDFDDFTPHFPSLAEARAATADDPDPDRRWRWTQIPAGWATTCPDCINRQTCAEQGHQWGPWIDCRCGGSNPAHTPTGCRPWRFCDRCAAFDHEPTPEDHP